MTPVLTAALPTTAAVMPAAAPAEGVRLAGGAVEATLVWSVLAVVMAAGAAATGLGVWRQERALGRRVHQAAGADSPTPRRQRNWAVMWRPADRRGGDARAGGRDTRRRLRETAAALIPFSVGVLVAGGPVGWCGGTAAGLFAWWWERRRSVSTAPSADADAKAEADAHRVGRQLPLAADLLSACLTAGAAPAQAADAVGRAVGGTLGARLVRAAAELRLGGEQAAVWGEFGNLPGCRQLARCMERAGTSGVPPAQSVARLAADCRARRSRAASERARRVAVQVTGPLGLCFLPAFLAVGVAPVILGLARTLL